MTTLILAGIFLVALGLRVWGVSFGLPYSYHFDEKFYISAALNLGVGNFHTGPYNPTGLSNLLFPQFAIYYLIGNVLGQFSSPQAFEAAYRADPTNFYLMSRLTVIIFGAATTLTLYLLGKASSSSKVGLLAAGLLAVNFLSVRDSHYGVPDIAMVFFVVLSVWLAARGLNNMRRRDIYLAGLAAGLSMAMKWTAFPVVAAVLWASICVGSKERKGILRKLINPTAVFSIFAVALGVSIGSPQILFNPELYFGHLIGLAEHRGGGGVVTVNINKWSYYGNSIYYGGGIVVMILGIAGLSRRVIQALKDRHLMSILLVLFPLIYFIVIIVFGKNFFLRYLLPLMPFAALFAAEIFFIFWSSLRNTRWGKVLGILILIAAIVLPLSNSIQHDLILSRMDTRSLAKEWIEASIPEGSKIAVSWPVQGPPLSTLEETMPNSERVYDVFYHHGGGLSDQSLDWYIEQGFDYMITSSYIYRWWSESNYPERHEFYTLLGDQFTHMITFQAFKGESEPKYIFDEIYGPVIGLWQRERPGPTLKIYKLQSGTGEQGS